MPRYLFDVDHGRKAPDTVGRDLPNVEAARRHAIVIAADFAGRRHASADDGGAIRVTVRDETGKVVLAVRLAMQVEMAPVRS